jgi:menaquinone-9 beta-reductase
MSERYDLIVVGGGPAGSAAAITAARAGARVLLLERGRFPRHKVCGEFVSAESLSLLSSLLDGQHLPLLRNAVLIPQGRIFVDGQVVNTPISPPAASIARIDLDIALWGSAEKTGVIAKQQVTVQMIRGSGPFQINTAVGEFEAQCIINASGRWSNLTAEVFEKQKTSDKWLGVKGHFSEPNPNTSVDLYFFEGGYCGVQPLSGNSVNACAMVRAEVGSTLPDVFTQHPALYERSRAWKSLSEPVFTSPLIFRSPQPVRNGILMAGDAASFVDPFVGDGISLALRSGSLAGECLVPFLKEQTSLAVAIENYQRTYQQRFASVFKISSKIRQMLRLPRPVRKPLVFMLQNAPAITRYLVSKTR